METDEKNVSGHVVSREKFIEFLDLGSVLRCLNFLLTAF